MEEKDREIVALVTQKNYDGLEKMIDCYGGTILRTIRYILNHPTEHSYLKEEIIQYREKNGLYQSIEELGKVSGIGEKTLESLKESITIK